MNIQPHQRFSRSLTLSPATVSQYAMAVGDTNPLHHDARFAASSPYGALVASGTQTTALLLGLTASHFAAHGTMVGLEFWVQFRRPVLADETITVEWLVVKVEERPDRRARLVHLCGRVTGQQGRTAVGAKGLVLVTQHPSTSEECSRWPST